MKAVVKKDVKSKVTGLYLGRFDQTHYFIGVLLFKKYLHSIIHLTLYCVNWYALCVCALGLLSKTNTITIVYIPNTIIPNSRLMACCYII